MVSAAPKIWSVSRSAEREIWKVGRSGEGASWSSVLSSFCSGAGRVQLKVVNKALSRKTIPKNCQQDVVLCPWQLPILPCITLESSTANRRPSSLIWTCAFGANRMQLSNWNNCLAELETTLKMGGPSGSLIADMMRREEVCVDCVFLEVCCNHLV